MAGLDAQTPIPTEIKLHQASRVLELAFDDGRHVPAAVRIPARVLAVGRSARPRPRPGNAAGRQARRRRSRTSSRSATTRCGRRSPTATTRASTRGTTCTTSACARTSSGSDYLERLARRRREPRSGAHRTPERRRDERPDPLRLRAGVAGREDAARARRVRLGRRQVRRDERPHVGRPASGVEALRRRRCPACVPARACSTSPAAPATSRACSRSASVATGTVVHTDINGAMLAAGRDKLLDEGIVLPTVQCNAEALPFRDRDVRLRVDRLRPAQRHAQGARARRDARACCVPGGVALVLEFSRVARPLAPAYDWYSFNVLPRLGRARRERRGELPLSRGIDPRASGPGDAEGDDGTSGLRSRRISQPHGGRRRPARGPRILSEHSGAVSLGGSP